MSNFILSLSNTFFHSKTKITKILYKKNSYLLNRLNLKENDFNEIRLCYCG